MKSYRCLIDVDGFRKTDTGKRKIWRTDNIDTYCCCLTPAVFVRERATKHNGYEPYTGYFERKHITIL